MKNAYNPQVEPISPTNDMMADEQSFRTTKDDLLQQIAKVDREIANNEMTLSILKKKQAELEEIASKPVSIKEVESEVLPKHQCLAQKIYLENRKKASLSHAALDSLGPRSRWPLYNQPTDAEVYHENKAKNVTIKKKLIEYFKRRHQEKESRDNYLVQTYSTLQSEWLRKVEKIESSQKRKVKEAKNREFFEKVFPELRKQREDKERFNRVGARIKSEADLEEIMDGLQEQELEDKKMRSYAVIPPIMLDARERRMVYTDSNGIVKDMVSDYKERMNLNVWTVSEKELFKEKYLQHPKNFGVIASYLERKNVQDCVQYYYLSKKTENYKQVLRKSRQKTRSSRNNPQKVNNQNSNTCIFDIISTGVTTRLQREQQQKTSGKDNKENRQSMSSSNDDIKNNRDPLAISQKDLARAAAIEKQIGDSKNMDSDETKAFITPVTICMSLNSESGLSNSVTITPASPGQVVTLNSVSNSHGSPDSRDSPVVVGINSGHAIINSPTNVNSGSGNSGNSGSESGVTFSGQLKKTDIVNNTEDKTRLDQNQSPSTTTSLPPEDVTMLDGDKENNRYASIIYYLVKIEPFCL